MRAYAQARMTAAPTATLPGMVVYGIASRPLYIVEIGIFNTTTTACEVNLTRFSTAAGTPGAAITAMSEDNEITPAGVARNSESGTVPTIVGHYNRASLCAAIGAGVIWTFGSKGLRVPAGTGNGVGILTLSGTGQICDAYFVWDE